MLVREEREGDHAPIGDITRRAFACEKHSDQTEHLIIERLRATDALTVSLVAVENETVIGHIAFSPVTISGLPGSWFGLGPVSVEPDRQGHGIGSALILDGLDRLRSRGAGGCVVLGDPAYYRRFGFEQAVELRYEMAPPEYFMCLCLNDDHPPSGRVDYAAAFDG